MDTPNEISSRRARGSARSTSRIAALSLMGLVVTFGAVTLVLQLIAIADGRTIPSDDFWRSNAVVAMGVSISGAAIALRRLANLICWALPPGPSSKRTASFVAMPRDEDDPTHAQGALLAVDSGSGRDGVAVWIHGESR